MNSGLINTKLIIHYLQEADNEYLDSEAFKNLLIAYTNIVPLKRVEMLLTYGMLLGTSHKYRTKRMIFRIKLIDLIKESK